jgi:hypothetical protein
MTCILSEERIAELVKPLDKESAESFWNGMLDVIRTAANEGAAEQVKPSQDEARIRLAAKINAYQEAMKECWVSAERQGGSLGGRDCNEVYKAIFALFEKAALEYNALLQLPPAKG